MSDEIRVHVVEYPDRKNLVMRYIDPITGKPVTRSAETPDRGKAERKAAVWEDELRAGRYSPPSRLTWAEFRDRYETEKLQALATGTCSAVSVSMNHLERVIDPDRLGKLTAEVLSRFQAKLREDGMKETTIAHHLRNIKAALRWGAAMGLMPKAPKIEMPKLPKGHTFMKGRPITGEEFDRMLAAVTEVRPKDATAWVRLLNGLWLSGLRLDEACNLSWDDDAPFSVYLEGRRPAFRIHHEAQKSRRDEILPMTPDFAEFLLRTPKPARHGRVFELSTLRRGTPFHSRKAGPVISAIGEKAGVVVNKAEEKYASAHDLRRAFGTRWSKREMPATLQRLMRHADISTTMKYYVSSSADDIADDLWAKYGPKPEPSGEGNSLGNSSPKSSKARVG